MKKKSYIYYEGVNLTSKATPDILPHCPNDMPEILKITARSLIDFFTAYQPISGYSIACG